MIPILDWTEYETDPASFSAKVGAACRDHGFFLLSKPAVALSLREAMFTQAKAFFALPDSEKAKIDIQNTPHFRGWAREGLESLDETRPEVDRKESFNAGYDLPSEDPRVIAGEPFRGVNQWPDLPRFRDTVLSYYDAALKLGIALHQAFATDLDLPEDYFERLFDEPLAALRILYYPAHDGRGDVIGAGAHTDYGACTLLMTDGEPGLQVRPRGEDWIDVPHLEDAYVVNIGDCMMRWTNDTYISTPHRVLPPKRERYSIAMFIEANPDTIVAALPGTGTPRYSPIRAAEYLQSRLDATYAPKEVS